MTASAKEHTLPELGLRVVLTMDVDRFPDALVRKGATGTVELSQEGMIEIKLDDEHPGLAAWDNCLQWNREMECEDGETLAEVFWSQAEETAPSPAP